MDVVFLVLIAGCLAAGVAGGLLSAWSCHRRLLALELDLKTILTSYEDRINQLTKIVVRQDKSDAAKARWSKKDSADESLIKTLTEGHDAQRSLALGHPWDPRTWGDPK